MLVHKTVTIFDTSIIYRFLRLLDMEVSGSLPERYPYFRHDAECGRVRRKKEGTTRIRTRIHG
ncbi:MAG: hypothetical protein ACRC62_37315 [Microcoleus sp.]